MNAAEMQYSTGAMITRPTNADQLQYYTKDLLFPFSVVLMPLVVGHSFFSNLKLIRMITKAIQNPPLLPYGTLAIVVDLKGFAIHIIDNGGVELFGPPFVSTMTGPDIIIAVARLVQIRIKHGGEHDRQVDLKHQVSSWGSRRSGLPR